MKLAIVTTGVALALAATPALAQLAGAGNLVSTSASPPSGVSNPNHQSTTMVNGGGGTRGVLYGVNGGDLAPKAKTSNLIVAPAQVRSNTQDRSVGFWAEAGANQGSVTQNPTVRANVDNGLGAGPNTTFRRVDLNVPTGNAGALGSGGTGKNLTAGLGNLTGKVPTQ